MHPHAHELPALPLAINGKFTAQRTTGVQRHALELLRALDDLLWSQPAHPLHRQPPVLWVPPWARPPALRLVRVQAVPAPWPGTGGRALYMWEQFALPRATRGALLLNLSGSAPAWAGPQVATLHDAALWDHPEAYDRAFGAWYRWLYRRLARQSLALLTVSRFSQARLAQALGLPLARLQVVPGGSGHLQAVVADDAVLQRLGLQPGRFIVAVASDNPTKNLARLVQAHALAGAGQPPLVLVGGGSAGVFAAPGVPAALPPGVVRAGVVSDAELKALLTNALALACPSLYEGFGLPLLEAMDCGCPVLAARAASLPEVAGPAALYADATDPAALAQALQRLAGDAALRQQLRLAGRERAAACTWAGSARALLSLLAPLLGLPAGMADATTGPASAAQGGQADGAPGAARAGSSGAAAVTLPAVYLPRAVGAGSAVPPWPVLPASGADPADPADAAAGARR